MRTKNEKKIKAGEKASDQVAISFSFESDWYVE